jgi:hypothetical protein
MTNRSRRSAEDRAEARRRARYAAQGREEELDTDGTEVADDTHAEGRGSFLSRLFPPAPPLPGKPDPLAGFAYDGPLRGLVAGFYLLARQPMAWLGIGAIWAVGRLILQFGNVIAILASLVTFGAVIAAGWVGWPRPWLFGLMASVVGILVFAAIMAALLSPPSGQSYGGWFLAWVYNEVGGLQPLFGVLAGWYGGYLRRRMATAQSRATPRRQR